jgi:hypothetical protein
VALVCRKSACRPAKTPWIVQTIWSTTMSRDVHETRIKGAKERHGRSCCWSLNYNTTVSHNLWDKCCSGMHYQRQDVAHEMQRVKEYDEANDVMKRVVLITKC